MAYRPFILMPGPWKQLLTIQPPISRLVQLSFYHQIYLTLSSTIQTLPRPVAKPDATAILTAVNGLVPNLEHALQALIAAHSNIEALPLPGAVALVEEDLAALKISADSFAGALISAAPVSLLFSWPYRKYSDDFYRLILFRLAGISKSVLMLIWLRRKLSMLPERVSEMK